MSYAKICVYCACSPLGPLGPGGPSVPCEMTHKTLINHTWLFQSNGNSYNREDLLHVPFALVVHSYLDPPKTWLNTSVIILWIRMSENSESSINEAEQLLLNTLKIKVQKGCFHRRNNQIKSS